ncbi:MAG TPA: hypothetical protein VFT42_09585 [Solirubrobacteraceae bacterium]|nr:hypothetical protein [Solirubrobacteraceae bacterium]
MESAFPLGPPPDPPLLAERRARRAELAERQAVERLAGAEREIAELQARIADLNIELASSGAERERLAALLTELDEVRAALAAREAREAQIVAIVARVAAAAREAREGVERELALREAADAAATSERAGRVAAEQALAAERTAREAAFRAAVSSGAPEPARPVDPAAEELIAGLAVAAERLRREIGPAEEPEAEAPAAAAPIAEPPVAEPPVAEPRASWFQRFRRRRRLRPRAA